MGERERGGADTLSPLNGTNRPLSYDAIAVVRTGQSHLKPPNKT